MSSLKYPPTPEHVTNPLAGLAFDTLIDLSNTETDLDWSAINLLSINITDLIPDLTNQDTYDGIPLEDLALALSRTSEGMMLMPTISNERLKLSWVLGDTGLWASLALAIIGALACLMTIVLCVKFKAHQKLFKSLFLAANTNN